MTKHINADKLDTRKVRVPLTPKGKKRTAKKGTGTMNVAKGAETFPQFKRRGRS